MRLLLRFFGFLFAVGTILFLVGVAAVAGLVWHYSRDLPDYSQLQDYEPPVMTRVHAADGSLLGEYAKERRLYLPIQAVPKSVINAFLAAEDKSFYEHGGLDFYGMARAGVAYAQNYGSNRRPQGASTITQQVAKNFLLTNEVSFTRKIKEALLAMRIERTYSKDKILELYLNEIFLGLGRLRHRRRLARLLRQVGERADDRRSRLSRGAAEGAVVAASGAQPRPRDRAAQLRHRSSAGERLDQAGRRRQGTQGAAGRHRQAERRAHLRRRIFCRRSPARHLRALRREKAL